MSAPSSVRTNLFHDLVDFVIGAGETHARPTHKKKKRKKKHQPIPINYRVIYRRRIKHELVTRIRIHTCPERRDLRIISDLGYATFHARSRSRVSTRNRILHYAHATLNPNYFEPSVSHSLRQN